MDSDELRRLLRAGPVWGAEIDIRFRVLALTIEPSADVHPDPAATDRRLQVLLHPVSSVAASLRQGTGGDRRMLQFTQDQLPDIVAAFDGATPIGDPLPAAPPDLDAITDQLSLRGQAQTGDGFRHHLHLDLAHDDLELDLWASFDEVEVRRPDQPAEGA